MYTSSIFILSPQTAKIFLEKLIETNTIQTLHVEREIKLKAQKIFKQNLKRKELSYTDATTIATIREYKIKTLLTYDTRSFQKLVDKIIGPNYWETLKTKEKERILKMIERYRRVKSV